MDGAAPCLCARAALVEVREEGGDTPQGQRAERQGDDRGEGRRLEAESLRGTKRGQGTGGTETEVEGGGGRETGRWQGGEAQGGGREPEGGDEGAGHSEHSGREEIRGVGRDRGPLFLLSEKGYEHKGEGGQRDG